jgi:formyl-CoA transferase/succinyl-CoA--D-citramalate CoA-transferase
MTGPLAGTRVLEMGSLIAGPFAGQLLGDYGAEVIKIEPVEAGDPMRRWGQTADGQSLWWPAIARNKRSVALNLRDPEGQRLVRSLAARCDIVIENFRPGTLGKWGLDYPRLSAVNPAIIVVHVSGFGQTGPRSSEAGFGSIGEAVGGIRFTTGDPDHLPARTGISLGDSLAAMFAVIGALAAFTARQASGRGQEVDVAIYEAVAALMESTMADYEHAGVLRTRTGSILPGVAPSNVYTCADGADIVIAGNADAVFRRLSQAMGRAELADDPRFADHAARGEHAAELDALVQAWCRRHDSAAVLKTLAAGGVPAGKIYTAPDMIADAHYLARDMVLRPDGPNGPVGPMAGIVPKFAGTPAEVRGTGPALGQDTRAVLRDLAGLADEEISDLLRRGLIRVHQ